MSAGSRKQVVDWLQQQTLGSSIASIPSHFALLFDRFFGDRHLTLRCFLRSTGVSLAVSMILFLGFLAWYPETVTSASDRVDLLWIVVWAGIINVLPDYVSLLETRYLLRHVVGRMRLPTILVLDAIATGTISFIAVALAVVA